MLASVLCGCTGLAHYRVDSQGIPFEDTPPAPYRVAVAPIVLAPGFTRVPEGLEEKLRFVYSAAELHTQIIHALNRYNGVSEAFTVSSLDLLEAQERGVDLLLRLTWVDAHLSHEETLPGRALLSSALWFGTWFGGLFVQDSLYHASLQLRATLINPHTGRELRRLPVESQPVALSFWDRNPVVSRQTIESMFLPPFWTSDETEATSYTLSEHVVAQISSQLVLLFKEGLEVEPPDAIARISIASPPNHSEVTGATRLQATVASAEAAAEPVLFVNGQRWQLTHTASESAPGDPIQIDAVIPLQPGRNEVQLRVAGTDETLSRTLILHNTDEFTFEELE